MRYLFLPVLLTYFFVGVLRAQQANIVLILADDLGYGDVSFNGRSDYLTPNIDGLASNGTWLSSGYVTHPFCSPSRAALLTGRYQQRFGHENQPDDGGLPLGELLLPQLLKPAGYFCGAIGKWHLGSGLGYRPLQRGFDEFYGFLGPSSVYFNAPLFRGDAPVTETAYLTDALTREAVSFIHRHAAQSFFLYLAYNAPHLPYDVPPQTYLDRVANISDPDRRTYAAMVTALDDGVGKVLQALRDNNLTDNTLIFFLSDNGAPLNSVTSNLPLQGGKLDTLEGGIRVPFAIQWSGHLPAGLVYGEPVSSLDIVATAASAAGLSLPSDRPYDGLDLIPYLTGQQVMPKRGLFWRWFGLGAMGPRGSVDTIYAMRQGSLKLVRDRALGNGDPQLYNLDSDIGETQDLSVSRPADLQALKALYNGWETQLIAPLWALPNVWQPSPIVLVGDWNGYNKYAASPWALTRIRPLDGKPTPDGYTWFVTTVHAATTGGDTTPGLHSFAVMANNSYSRQWGGVTINVDGTTTLPSSSGTSLGSTNSISLEDGFYYSFRLIKEYDPDNQTRRLTTMKTSAPPVTVSRSGQTPAAPTPNDVVTIQILTSQPKSPQERIFLRWSTDTFVTSHMTEAVGSGMTYSAQIPPQPAGTAVQYCIATSTSDLSQLSASGAIDLLTLETSSVFKFVNENPGIPQPPRPPTPPPGPGPTPSADLQISVSDGKTSVIAGTVDTYTISVTNLGPDVVSGASIADTFPSIFGGVTYTATQVGAASGFTASGSGNINDTVTMPWGSKIVYKATGKVTSAATGTLSNTATVAAPFGVAESNPTNNGATDSDTITVKADLKISVSDGRTSVVPGTVDIYTITVSNLGPAAVTSTSVIDTFPGIFQGVTYTATQVGGASGFTASGTGNINDTVTMPSGSKITYKATGKVSPAATGTFSNTATVAAPSGVTESNPANNSATDSDAITVRADLKIILTDGKSAAVAGTQNTYTITVNNVGPSNISGAVISDAFPSTFTGIAYTATQSGGASGFSASGSSNINDTVIMPSSSKITYKAAGTISASATGSLSNRANVTPPSGITDPNLANNSATDTDTL